MSVSSKPIAVHLHLYYTDMWQELSEQLKNLETTSYDLFVTLVEGNPSLEQKIKEFHPSSTIWIVENMGYDIGPFMEFLNRINLDDYDYILKLHSKHPTNGAVTKFNRWPVSRRYWKILLSEALIGSPKIWQRNLLAFAQNEKLGMIGSPALIKRRDHTDEPFMPVLQDNLKKIGLPPQNNFYFVAGTMFIVRSSLFKVLQNHYRIYDFQPTDGQVRNGTLAHIFERLFGAVVYAQGYTINGFHWNWKFLADSTCRIILRFFYQKKASKNNKLIIKICKIPVFQKKITEKNEPF